MVLSNSGPKFWELFDNTRSPLSHDEELTLAALLQIANRIKSKGLQKLRWYCQMCEKQCRDENGFKCHLTSEGHKRQMMVFGQNPDRGVSRLQLTGPAVPSTCT